MPTRWEIDHPPHLQEHSKVPCLERIVTFTGHLGSNTVTILTCDRFKKQETPIGLIDKWLETWHHDSLASSSHRCTVSIS
jgi:hypothetical protein